MTTQLLLLFDIRPLRTSSLLVYRDTLAEFLIPYMSRGEIYGIWGKRECESFGLLAVARALSGCYKYYLSNFFSLMIP